MTLKIYSSLWTSDLPPLVSKDWTEWLDETIEAALREYTKEASVFIEGDKIVTYIADDLIRVEHDLKHALYWDIIEFDPGEKAEKNLPKLRAVLQAAINDIDKYLNPHT
jgi:hypothetical protein